MDQIFTPSGELGLEGGLHFFRMLGQKGVVKDTTGLEMQLSYNNKRSNT